MRDHTETAQSILLKLKKQKGSGTQKREFMLQLNNFIKDFEVYPPEARLPWDTLGHLMREYCSKYGKEVLSDWQKEAIKIVKGGGK